jgi:hypothetical protein
MRKIKLVVFSLLLALGIALGYSQSVSANQTPSQSYCMSWAALHNLLISNWTNPLYLGVGCGLQPGDLFTDGPLYNPVPSTISGLTWTIPANTFIANGQRVVTQALPTSAPNNTTSYFWLDCNACSGSSYGTWESTTTSSPPHSYSSLQYTVFTSSGSIAQLTPTMNSAVFGSGFLNLTGNYDGAIYSGAIKSDHQMLFVDSGQPAIVMGGSPIFQFHSTANECVDGSLVQYGLVQFSNDSNTSPVIIGCSTDTGDVLQPALLVTGRALFNAIFDSTFSASTVPICGSNTVALTSCSNGAVLAAIASSPVPQTTAAPFVISDTTSVLGTVGAWVFNVANAGCAGTAHLITFEANGTVVGDLNCRGDWTLAGLLSATNILNSGLGASVVPICGSNASNEASCSNGAVLAAIASAPVPQTTSAPFVITDTTSVLGTVGAWVFNVANTGCVTTNHLITFKANGTIVGDLDCSGSWVISNNITASGDAVIGTGTPPTTSAGDLVALDATVFFGNSTTNCKTDYGKTISTTFTIGCALRNGGNTANFGATTVTNLKNTGLGASSAPVCGSNSTNEAACNVSTQVNKCGTVDPTTGHHLECQAITNASFSCTITTVCTVGTMTFVSAFPDTNYICNGNQSASSTTYANRALNVGFLARATGSIAVEVSAPVAVSTINLTILVTCTE